MTISEKIIAVRTQLNLSQEGFAKLLGISRQAVSRWEKDEASPDVKRLMLICGAIGCTLDEFVSDDFDFTQDAAEKGRREKAEAERVEAERRENLRRIANVKCTGIVCFKISAVFSVIAGLAILFVDIFRWYIAGAFGFKYIEPDILATFFPTLFMIITCCLVCGFSPLFIYGIKNGKNMPLVAAIALATVNIMAIISGLTLVAYLYPLSSVTFAGLKIMAFISIFFALTIGVFDCACVLYILDSAKKTPYEPLPPTDNEKYIFLAYIIGGFVGFVGTPIFWSAGLIVHSGIRKRTPVFADKFVRSLVIGAIAEVVAIGLFFILRYIIKAF